FLGIAHVDARTNVSGKRTIFMESRHTDIEHPTILPIVPPYAALLLKRLSLIEGLEVNLEAPLVVLWMDNLGQATLKIGFRSTREVQPKLIEINALFVRSRHPDHHRCRIGYQTEAPLALAYSFLGSVTLGNVLHYARDAIDAGGTFNGKVGDEYVSFAKLGIRILHFESDDFTSKTSIQF